MVENDIICMNEASERYGAVVMEVDLWYGVYKNEINNIVRMFGRNCSISTKRSHIFHLVSVKTGSRWSLIFLNVMQNLNNLI